MAIRGVIAFTSLFGVRSSLGQPTESPAPVSQSALDGLPETANRGHLNETTVGLHLAATLRAAFDYEIEMDRRTGSLGPNSIRAWAGYWSLGRTFRGVAASPRLFVESNYASGTRNPSAPLYGPVSEDSLAREGLFLPLRISDIRLLGKQKMQRILSQKRKATAYGRST